MQGHQAEFAATLRERSRLAGDSDLLTTWSGYLVELRMSGRALNPEHRPPILLGITESRLHLLCEAVQLSAGFELVLGPHSPYQGLLRFSIRDGVDRIDLGIALRNAYAIAGQLADARLLPVEPAVADAPSRRTKPKRRPPADYLS